MKPLFLILSILFFFACQPKQAPTDIPIAYQAQENPYQGLPEWQVDLIWQGTKVIGGGPFPKTDTLVFYMEDANVSIWSKTQPDIEEVKKQAKPPITGYSLLGMQGRPKRVLQNVATQ